MGNSLSDCLFDTVGGSTNKEVRPFQWHLPSRVTLPIRQLGGYKSNESNFQKLKPIQGISYIVIVTGRGLMNTVWYCKIEYCNQTVKIGRGYAMLCLD